MNAKLSKIKAGDTVEVIGFACMSGRKIVLERHDELCVPCKRGFHYFKGQIDDADNDSLVGIFEVKP